MTATHYCTYCDYYGRDYAGRQSAGNDRCEGTREQVHTLIIKAAPPELVMVGGIECYIGRDGHPYVANGPAKGVLPNSFLYWRKLEQETR